MQECSTLAENIPGTLMALTQSFRDEAAWQWLQTIGSYMMARQVQMIAGGKRQDTAASERETHANSFPWELLRGARLDQWNAEGRGDVVRSVRGRGVAVKHKILMWWPHARRVESSV